MPLANRLGSALFAFLCALLFLLPPAQLTDILLDAQDGVVKIDWRLPLLATGLVAVATLILRKDRLALEPYLESALAIFPMFAVVLLAASVDIGTISYGLPCLTLVFFCCELLTRHLDRIPAFSGPLVSAIAVLGIIFLAHRFAVDPVNLPVAIGPVAMLFIGVGCLSLLLAILVRYPAFAAVYLAMCLIGYSLGRPPNSFPTIEGAGDYAPNIDGAFIKWLDARKDDHAYDEAKRPYPVIIASSEGGGIYAAAHSLEVLTAMDAQCPNFTQHLFLTVGVSGGGFGNALFAAKTRQRVQPENLSSCNGPGTSRAQASVELDYLTPLLANLLVVQPTEFLLAGPQFSPDGAAVLAAAFEEADKEALHVPLRASWSEEGSGPATAFVATEAVSGRRYVMAPFTEEIGGTAYFFPEGSNTDLRVSSAAALSALFPWLTSTGRIETVDGAQRVLADGGYAENTGAETVVELIGKMRFLAKQSQECRANNIKRAQQAQARGLEYYPEQVLVAEDIDLCACPLIVHDKFDVDIQVDPAICERNVFFAYLAISAEVPLPGFDDISSPGVSQSYFLDPLSVILSARARNSVLSLEKAKLELTEYDPAGVGGASTDSGVFSHVLPVSELELPLGWKLSHSKATAIQNISAHIGTCPIQTRKPTEEDRTEYYEPDPKFPEYDEGPYSEDPIENIKQLNGCDMKMLAWLFNPRNVIEPYSIKGHGP